MRIENVIICILTSLLFSDNPVNSMLHLQGCAVSDLSSDSSPAHVYPDFHEENLITE